MTALPADLRLALYDCTKAETLPTVEAALALAHELGRANLREFGLASASHLAESRSLAQRLAAYLLQAAFSGVEARVQEALDKIREAGCWPEARRELGKLVETAGQELTGPAPVNGVASEFVPTSQDLTILRVLDAAGCALAFSAIVREAASMVKRLGGPRRSGLVLLSETKVSERAPILLENNLIDRPQGAKGKQTRRKGVGITPHGKKLLAGQTHG